MIYGCQIDCTVDNSTPQLNVKSIGQMLLNHYGQIISLTVVATLVPGSAREEITKHTKNLRHLALPLTSKFMKRGGK